MNLDNSLQKLFRRNLHLVKLDLESMKALLDLLGNPHQSFLAVHVAGTNGKGSVCAMLDRILREQGYKAGLYTSPHLVKFNERIKVGGTDIDDKSLTDLITEIENAAEKLRESGSRDVTFFEFTTALAFLHFQRSGVEIAVIETGMGGRLDATNVMIPVLSVITSIGLEHQEYLGGTIEQIAGEKAGIIKPGRPVVLGIMAAEASLVIKKRAEELNAPVRHAEDIVNVVVNKMSIEGQTLNASSQSADYGTIHTHMNGMHQASNTAIAVAAAECLDEAGVTIDTGSIKKGLANAEWPARCQLIADNPPVIVDGGHNPDAAKALAAWIRKVGSGKPLGMIVGFLADKNPEAFMKEFSSIAKKVWLVPVQSERGMPMDEMKSRLSFLKNTSACEDLACAKKQAVDWAGGENGMILVTGSLYLAGEMLAGFN